MGNAASIGRAMRKELSAVVGGVMLRALDNVINSTPVDTTHASNNWIASTGSPSSMIDGSRENPSHALEDQGREALVNYDVGRDGAVYLRNNVSYVKYLDEGWSQQADPDFIETALQAAASGAPYGRKGSVRKMLRGLARQAITRRAGAVRRAAIARNLARHGRSAT